MALTQRDSTLTRLAWANAVGHGIGLVLALVAMRPGTPAIALDERLRYLAGAPRGWALGWATWMICALLLLAFLHAASSRISVKLASLVTGLAAAGVAIDLLCDSLYIVLLPQLAQHAQQDASLFLAVERTLGVGGAVVANGLYTLAALAVNLHLPPLSGRLKMVRLLGLGVGLFGAGMVVAGFTGVPRHLELATGPTIGVYCLWALGVAYFLPTASHAAMQQGATLS